MFWGPGVFLAPFCNAWAAYWATWGAILAPPVVRRPARPLDANVEALVGELRGELNVIGADGFRLEN